MRVALVWNARTRLIDISVRYELYVVGLRSLGLDVVTVCPVGTEEGYPSTVRCFTDERELADPEFWRELGCQAVVMVTWHRMTEVLIAARAAGGRVLAICDSDGQVSPRLHPWSTFQYMICLQSSWRGKLGSAKYWLQRFLFHAAEEHRTLVENVGASDVSTLPGQEAAKRFRRFICLIGTPDLADRVAWLPYPVSDMFCEGTVEQDRADRVIAIGRWDSPQKNPGLLAATIDRLHTAGNHTEILIVGRSAEKRFAHLARRNPSVRVLGIQPRERIRELMAECLAVHIPSRWEGCPIVANEMLALGGTVVGTPILSLRALTVDGKFGRVSRSHASGALANAVREEMAAWVRGEKESDSDRQRWREPVSPTAVAGRMLELLGLQARSVGPLGQRS